MAFLNFKQAGLYFLSIIMLFTAFCVGQAFGGEQEGVISGNVTVQGVPADEAARSSADWWDVKPLIGAVDTASVITPAAKWGTTKVWMPKAIYNNRGTATVIKIATFNKSAPGAADTVRLKLDAYQMSPKLPRLSKIFKLASTDSLLVFLQVD